MKVSFRIQGFWIITLLVTVMSLSPIEYEKALTLKVENYLRERGLHYSYRYLGNGLFEFTDPITHASFRYMVMDYRPLGGLKPKKIQTIDISNIDTTGFATMFNIVDTLPLGTSSNIVAGIEGKSGNRYIAGPYLKNNHYAGTVALRWRNTDNSFILTHLFNNVVAFTPIGQANVCYRDLPHLFGDAGDRLVLIVSNDSSDIPDRQQCTRDGRNSTLQYPRIYDMDADGKDECVLRNDVVVTEPAVYITKYDTAHNLYLDVFRDNYDGNYVYGSFAVGDFDNDNKGDLAYSAMGGYVRITKYDTSINAYKVVFDDTTRAVNGGYNCSGRFNRTQNKDQVIIGTNLFGGMINLAVYQHVISDIYELPLWIEIYGLTALKNGITAGDIDGDSIDEIILWIGNVLAVLKIRPDDTINVIYLKYFNNEICASVYDVNRNGVDEIFVSTHINYPTSDGITTVLQYQNANSNDVIRSAMLSTKMRVYPQPTADKLFVDVMSNAFGTFTITLFDLEGHKIYSKVLTRKQDIRETIIIDTSILACGLYYIAITEDECCVINKVLILR